MSALSVLIRTVAKQVARTALRKGWKRVPKSKYLGTAPRSAAYRMSEAVLGAELTYLVNKTFGKRKTKRYLQAQGMYGSYSGSRARGFTTRGRRTRRYRRYRRFYRRR